MSDRPPQKPDFCPFIYHDGVDIYLEFSSGSVLRFTLSEGGLHKALAHIPNVTRQPGFLSGGRNIAERVLAKPIKVARKTQQTRDAKERASKLSDHAKAGVREIIRSKFR